MPENYLKASSPLATKVVMAPPRTSQKIRGVQALWDARSVVPARQDRRPPPTSAKRPTAVVNIAAPRVTTEAAMKPIRW